MRLTNNDYPVHNILAWIMLINSRKKQTSALTIRGAVHLMRESDSD